MTDLADRVTRRIMQLAPRERQALFRRVECAETEVELLHRNRAGARPVPHPIALTPFVVPRRRLPLFARLAECIHRFQALAPVLYRENRNEVRALCPLSETIAGWLGTSDRRPAPWALMIRPDVGLDPGPRAVPAVFETNATALAGLYNHTAGVAILRREVFPRLLAAADCQRLRPPPDLLALTLTWVLAAARRLGRTRPLGVAFLEEAGEVAGYSEVPRLMQAFAARGLRVVHGAPEQLRLARCEVTLHGVRVDVAYRDLGYDALGPRPTGDHGRLAGVLALHARRALLPDMAGEFGHKGLLELITAPEYARLFSAPERRLLAACIPWTRVLAGRRTAGPSGGPVDLLEYARRHRARLLIKPNVGSSGEGVLLGRETTATRWEARLARAVREPGAWVVQERRAARPRLMVYLRDRRAYAGPCHSSLGLFYAPGHLGLHCRVSRAPIVNVAQGGALACAFLGT